MIGKIIKKIRTGFYTNLCKKTAKQYGKGLHINHWSKFTSKTYIGDNCHFNGMLQEMEMLLLEIIFIQEEEY